MRLTDSQKHWLRSRKVKEGGIYMFPMFGFEMFSAPDYSKGQYLHTNPFNRSLSHERFIVKSIKGNFCRVNFYRKPHTEDFYLVKSDLEYRGLIEKGILKIITFVPMMIFNLITNKK